MMGANVARGKWIRGKLILSQRMEGLNEITTYGTKLVWNSLRSTFKEPSNRNDAVIEETTWAINLLRLVRLGDVMPKFFLQMS